MVIATAPTTIKDARGGLKAICELPTNVDPIIQSENAKKPMMLLAVAYTAASVRESLACLTK